MQFILNDITPASTAPFPGHAPADEVAAIHAALHDARRFWIDPDAADLAVVGSEAVADGNMTLAGLNLAPVWLEMDYEPMIPDPTFDLRDPRIGVLFRTLDGSIRASVFIMAEKHAPRLLPFAPTWEHKDGLTHVIMPEGDTPHQKLARNVANLAVHAALVWRAITHHLVETRAAPVLPKAHLKSCTLVVAPNPEPVPPQAGWAVIRLQSGTTVEEIPKMTPRTRRLMEALTQEWAHALNTPMTPVVMAGLVAHHAEEGQDVLLPLSWMLDQGVPPLLILTQDGRKIRTDGFDPPEGMPVGSLDARIWLESKLPSTKRVDRPEGDSLVSPT